MLTSTKKQDPMPLGLKEGRHFQVTSQSALWSQSRKWEALNLAYTEEREGHPRGRNGMCPWHILEGEKESVPRGR